MLVVSETTFEGTSNTYGDWVAYRFDASTGSFTRGGNVAAPQRVVPGPLAVHPNEKWVYAGGGTAGPNGDDAPLGEAFVTDASTASLTPLPGAPYWAGQNAGGVVVHPSGKFVYYAQSGGSAGYSGLLGFTLNADGSPGPQVPNSPLPSAAAPISISPDGKFLYLLGGTAASSEVDAYSIDAGTGALSRVGSTPVNASVDPSNVSRPQITPSGTFLYVGVDSGIFGFRRDGQTGQLTPMGNWHQTGATHTTTLAISPEGKFLYSAECVFVSQLGGTGCGGQSTLQTYSIDANGQLTPVSAEPIPQSSGISLIAASGFVFLGTSTIATDTGNDGYVFHGTITAYAVDAQSGKLTSKGSASVDGDPVHLVFIGSH